MHTLRKFAWLGLLLAGWPLVSARVSGQKPDSPQPRRNIVIVVFDGLRAGSVNETDSPTMYMVRTRGVAFANSHSLFPTFTTANASAIATGHYLGDTGDFSNTIYIGHPVFRNHTFDKLPGTYSPYVENDAVLADLDNQFHGNYLNEETLVAAARQNGFRTALVGKMGPAAIQDVSQLNPAAGRMGVPQTIVIDDGTGTPDGVPLAPEIAAALADAGLPAATPARDQPMGNNSTPGTRDTNHKQQDFFAAAFTKVILPMFRQSGQPFVILYWSRDPDGTQHNQGDSLNQFVPGINGPTSKAALRNADNNLKQILDTINSDPQLAANTDIFVTADHGFGTISLHDVDAEGRATASYAAKFTYRDAQGRQEVNTGFLPRGFVAIDLAHELGLSLFDPDTPIPGPDGSRIFARVDPGGSLQIPSSVQRPASGNGLIGGTGRIAEETDAQVVVAANGGSDLIYLPRHDAALAARIVKFLAKQDYVGGIFVNDAYGRLPGALPTSAIRLVGSSPLPSPTIVIAFKTFVTDPANPLMTAVQITDSAWQQGQGMHGSFGRANTFNFMSAIGPDFKQQFVDSAPISNADVAPTIARILSLQIPAKGLLKGRVLSEALAEGPAAPAAKRQVMVSGKSENGWTTILEYQQLGEQVYFDKACFKPAPAGKSQAACP